MLSNTKPFLDFGLGETADMLRETRHFLRASRDRATCR